jgi:hypothetical protein
MLLSSRVRRIGEVDEEYKNQIDSIAQKIVDLARERIEKGEPYQNLNSAVHGIVMDVSQPLMAFMDKHKKE